MQLLPLRLRNAMTALATRLLHPALFVPAIVIAVGVCGVFWLHGAYQGLEWPYGPFLKPLGHYARVDLNEAGGHLVAGLRDGDDIILAGARVTAQAALVAPAPDGIRVVTTGAAGTVRLEDPMREGAEIDPVQQRTLQIRRGGAVTTVRFVNVAKLEIAADGPAQVWSVVAAPGLTSRALGLSALVCAEDAIAITSDSAVPDCSSQDGVVRPDEPITAGGTAVEWSSDTQLLAESGSGSSLRRAFQTPDSALLLPEVSAAVVWRERPPGRFERKRPIVPVVVSTALSQTPLEVAGYGPADLPLAPTGARIRIGEDFFRVHISSEGDVTLVALFKDLRRWKHFSETSSAAPSPGSLAAGQFLAPIIPVPPCADTNRPRPHIWMRDPAPPIGDELSAGGTSGKLRPYSFRRPRWVIPETADGLVACADNGRVIVSGQRGIARQAPVTIDRWIASGGKATGAAGQTEYRLGDGDVIYFGGQIFELGLTAPRSAWSSLKLLALAVTVSAALPLIGLMALSLYRRLPDLPRYPDQYASDVALRGLTLGAPLIAVVCLAVLSVSGAWYQLRLAVAPQLVGHLAFYSTLLTATVLGLAAATGIVAWMSARGLPLLPRLGRAVLWSATSAILGLVAQSTGRLIDGWLDVADNHLYGVLDPPTPFDAHAWLLGIFAALGVIGIALLVLGRTSARGSSLGLDGASEKCREWAWSAWTDSEAQLARLRTSPEWAGLRRTQRIRRSLCACVPLGFYGVALLLVFIALGIAGRVLFELLPTALAMLLALHLGAMAPFVTGAVVAGSRPSQWLALATSLVAMAAISVALYYGHSALATRPVAWAMFLVGAILLSLVWFRGPWQFKVILRTATPYVIALIAIGVIGDLGFALVWAFVLMAIIILNLLVLVSLAEANVTRKVAGFGLVAMLATVALPVAALGIVATLNSETIAGWGGERTATRIDLVSSPFYADESDWLARVRLMSAGMAPGDGWLANLNSDVAVPGARRLASSAHESYRRAWIVVGLLLIFGMLEAYKRGVALKLNDKSRIGVHLGVMYVVAATFFSLVLLMVAHLVPAYFESLPFTGVPAPWISHANLTHVAFTVILIIAAERMADLAATPDRGIAG